LLWGQIHQTFTGGIQTPVVKVTTTLTVIYSLIIPYFSLRRLSYFTTKISPEGILLALVNTNMSRHILRALE